MKSFCKSSNFPILSKTPQNSANIAGQTLAFAGRTQLGSGSFPKSESVTFLGQFLIPSTC